MQRLSSKLVLLGGEPTHWCPGCKQVHRIDVNAPNKYSGARWTFDGNVDSPTFHPSINIVGRCHYFLKGGKLQFLPDCTHDLKGTTVDLPDFPKDEEEDWS